MEKYDVLIVGGSTTGCWFADRMAQTGAKVLVIEKQLPDDVSREYDIFHMGEEDMKRFGLEIPDEGHPVREFRFENSNMISPYGTYRKKGAYSPVIGLHKHDYIMLMAEKAQKSGAEFIYGASFTDFVYENGKIVGAKYKTADGEETVYAKIVADCSGIPSVARTKLPDTSAVCNFKLTPRDIFYVVLYYIEYADKNINPRDLDGFFMQYKSWSAPAGEGYDAILGIGGSYSYEYSEEVFNTHLLKNVKYPEYTVKKVEKGMTPYHRSVYSFVDDGFIAMGDAACLTKPTCGEGCTSSLVQAEIAVDVISTLLKEKLPLSKENMWSINKRYMVAQGKDFDFMRPLLMGVVTLNYDEAEYMFENEIIFSDALFSGMDGDDLNLKPADVAKWLAGIAKGVAKKKIRASAVGNVVKGLKQALEIGTLYDNYPDTPHGFDEWKKKADAKWTEIGSLADTCDPEIMEKLGY
ncbi:MAG: NAD(P)/FAD-dependent oxidoreductase [Clostridia bacterium]|nr:NAD(P)/FAD-dependent oxidoreductase [Clostridia bacterium]